MTSMIACLLLLNMSLNGRNYLCLKGTATGFILIDGQSVLEGQSLINVQGSGPKLGG